MKYIFNSLGSNYSLSFVLHALLYFFIVPPRKTAMQQLDTRLRKLFPDFELGPYYLYKGRDAIEFLLTAFGVTDDEPVLTQAFTCHALESAIRRAGGLPAYVDIDTKTLNPTIETIQQAYKKYPDARVLIVQHTLGVPAEIEKIRAWCSSHKIMLIEDLAQAVGGTDSAGVLLGSTADAVVFSFGRDKIIDAVTGGACLIKEKPFGFSNQNYRTVTSTRFKRDHLYPALTYVIRKLYPFFVGKVLLYVARFFRLIQSPIKPRFEYITALPSAIAALAERQFLQLDSQLAHRKKITQVYLTELASICPVPAKRLLAGSCLRFPVVVTNPDALIKYLATQKIFVQDRWYRSAVDSGSLKYFSKYKQGSCPQAEELSQHVVNLPTHLNITPEEAAFVAQQVQIFLRK